MKHASLILFALSISVISSAQWHYRSCGVETIENTTADELRCLWKKSNNTIWTGVLLTVVGTSTIVLGWAADKELPRSDTFTIEFITIPLGIVIDLIGIPALLVGLDRKYRVIHSPSFVSESSWAIDLSPSMINNAFNHSNVLGLTARLKF